MAKRPPMKPNDVHVIVNDFERTNGGRGEATCYDASGKVLWKIPALGKGVAGPRTDIPRGDTPAGLYKAGAYIPTKASDPWKDKAAYGMHFIDFVELEDQERKVGRSEIGIHGGGTGLPDPLAPRQQLLPTLGCVRVHNEDLAKLVVPTYQRVTKAGGTVYITVNQLP